MLIKCPAKFGVAEYLILMLYKNYFSQHLIIDHSKSYIRKKKKQKTHKIHDYILASWRSQEIRPVLNKYEKKN